MNNIAKWLDREGFQYRTIQYVSNGSVMPAIMIDNNYDGEYPKHETWVNRNKIVNKINRCKSWKYEDRGHYTAVLIWQI